MPVLFNWVLVLLIWLWTLERWLSVGVPRLRPRYVWTILNAPCDLTPIWLPSWQKCNIGASKKWLNLGNIHECKTKKYLGLIADNKLNFYDHIKYIKRKLSKGIGAMYRSKSLLPLSFRKMFANALMLPQFDYLDIIWSKTFKNRLNELYILYKKSSQDCSRCECSRIICRNVQKNGMVSSPSKETATS